MNIAVKSVVAIENVRAAIDQIAQTTLRKVVGQHSLDQTLSETDAINLDIRKILDVTTVEWGVEGPLPLAAGPLPLARRHRQRELRELAHRQPGTASMQAPTSTAYAKEYRYETKNLRHTDGQRRIVHRGHPDRVRRAAVLGS